MTAPVHMDINDSVSLMSFVMPLQYNENNLPKPDDSKILIHKTSDEYVAAIRFGGFASDNDMAFRPKDLGNGHYLMLSKCYGCELFGVPGFNRSYRTGVPYTKQDTKKCQ